VGDATTAAIAVEKYLACGKKAPREGGQWRGLKSTASPTAPSPRTAISSGPRAGEAVLIDPGEDAPCSYNDLHPNNSA